MDVREFTKTVREELPDFLPDDVYEDLIIEDVEISKMNDQRLHGLIFRVKGSDAAPTLYIDDLHERHENGEDLGYLLVELANRYEGARHAPAPPDVDLTWDRARENLSVRLIEKQRNRDFLRERPYVDVGNGLALICDINMGEDRGGDWRVNINRSLLESFGVDTESLFAEALNRAPEIEPPVLTDMGQALFSPDKVNLLEGDIHIAPEDLGNMYVLTNEAGTFGAAALFYPDIKEKTAEILGSGYYVLPSSVHEVILVPEAAGINEKELCDMVKQANRTVVEPQDVLSDNFDELKALASKLQAAVGCTRSFVDLGLVPDESTMIGTSGKSVKPQLFLGFGISGAAHHTCGMNKSKLVITVNKDEKARMFQESDFGVVGDAGKVIRALNKMF